MQVTRRTARVVRAMFVGAMVIALAGCTLPRSGPTAGEILRAGDDPELGLHIVAVTPSVAAAARSEAAIGFGSQFTGAGPISADAISPGDTLAITVWENVDAGLLAGIGQRATAVQEIQVDESGQIFMPYVGRVRVAGSSPEEVRGRITEGLIAQTPDPQVEVRRLAGDGATVTVLGDVREPGVYPIETPTLRLSAMIASAGGVAIVPETAQVKLERGGRTGSVWLQDLYDNPSFDVALRSGDRIIVEQDRRTFTALGATTTQASVPFSKRDMSAIEALGASGGLEGNSADPTGIFVFRAENSDVANRVTGRADLIGTQRVAYVIDLTEPQGMFAAREFVIRDEDTVYVTEAPLAAWRQVINFTAAAVALGGSVAALSN